MGLGVLIDALVVRSVLVPALLTLLGGFSAWPRKLKGAEVEREAAESAS
jgi:RND superfamily putative drug exporter